MAMSRAAKTEVLEAIRVGLNSLKIRAKVSQGEQSWMSPTLKFPNRITSERDAAESIMKLGWTKTGSDVAYGGYSGTQDLEKDGVKIQVSSSGLTRNFGCVVHVR